MWIISCDHNRRVALEKNFAVVQTAAGVKEKTGWALNRIIQSPDMVWCFFGEEYTVERGAPANHGLRWSPHKRRKQTTSKRDP